MKLSNTQKKILKQLRKEKLLFIDTINPAFSSAIDYLEKLELIQKKNFATAKEEGTTLKLDSIDLYIILTQKGEAETDNLLLTKIDRIRPWVPIIISLLALILSFFTNYSKIFGIK